MQRIISSYVMQVTAAFIGLDQVVANKPVREFGQVLLNAITQIQTLYNNSVYSGMLKSSRSLAQNVESAVRIIVNNEDYDRHLSENEVWSLRQAAEHFIAALRAEFDTAPTYLVMQKGSFDTLILLENGGALFPPTLYAKAPETKRDADEAGRALAFELGTACGFHAFRVTESVVRRYWDAVAGKRRRPKLQTLGNFAAEMEKHKLGDVKIVESIKQMTRLHRNPLIHPEVILTVEEAIGILGMSRSIVAPMLSVLPDVPVTTTGVFASALAERPLSKS